MFAGLIRKFCLESQQQRRRSRAKKYQMKGERNDGNFFKSFHRNLSKDLFLAMYTPLVGEIKSIPAIFDTKVSNKNFQPTIDHKKRKKTEEKLLKPMKPVRFSDFHRSPFINGVSNGF